MAKLNTAGFSRLLLFSIGCNVLFWWKYIKKNWPDTCSWKGDDVLTAFSDNCGYSTLMLYQILTSSFLKVCYNLESEIKSMNFLYSITLKLIGLSYILMDILPMHDFVTSCTDHLENTGLIRYAELANVAKFPHII